MGGGVPKEGKPGPGRSGKGRRYSGLQIGSHFICALVTVLWILCKCLFDDKFDCRRKIRSNISYRRHRIIELLRHNGKRIRPGKGGTAFHYLIQNDPHLVVFRTTTKLTSADLL